MVTGCIQSLIKLCDLDWTAPNISDTCTPAFAEDKSILIFKFAMKDVLMNCLAQYIAHSRFHWLEVFR